MTERLNINIPKGRFTHGSLTDLVTTDDQKKPLPPEQYYRQFGLAVPKTDPDLPALFQQILGFANASYAHAPAVQAAIGQWSSTLSGFSMKITDGDKPNTKGVTNPNMVGNYMFWFRKNDIMGPISTCMPDNTHVDASTIKRGYYIDVAANIAINGRVDTKAGIYMNPDWVRLREYGDEIVGGVSASDAFGGIAKPALGPAPAGNVSGLPGAGVPPSVAPAVTPVGGLPGSTTASPTEHPPHPDILGAGGLPGA